MDKGVVTMGDQVPLPGTPPRLQAVPMALGGTFEALAAPSGLGGRSKMTVARGMKGGKRCLRHD